MVGFCSLPHFLIRVYQIRQKKARCKLHKIFDDWIDATSHDMDYIQDKTEEQLADLRQIEGLTRHYLETYGQMEIVLPYQKSVVRNTDFVEFNPIWD